MPYVAASSIIVNSAGRVLVGRRSLKKKNGPGQWETIGGSIDNNETPEECIRREIKEELNSEIETCAYFKDYKSEKGGIAVFIVTLNSEPVFDENDFEEIRWVLLGDIENLDFVLDCKQRIIDYFNLE